MVFMRWPSGVRTPWTEAPDDRLLWTPQPNGMPSLCVTVAGADPDAPAAQPHVPYEEHLTSFPLRDYQDACIRAVEASYLAGKKAPLIVLPTGTGKTITAAALMQRSFERWRSFRGYKDALVSRCLFLAHRRELLDQTYDKVHAVADHLRVGICQQKRNDLNRDITVASIDTLARSARRMNEVLAHGPYHLIICDEAHHAVSAKWRKVLDALKAAYPDALILGMTATPGRDDGVALDEVFDTIAYEMSLHEAILRGALVPPRQFRVRVDVEFDKVEVDGVSMDFKRPALSQLMNTPPVNLAVVRAWQEYGHDRKMLAFAVDVAHARALAETFSDEGVTSLSIDGSMLDTDRDAAIRSFRHGTTKILVSCEVLLEGFDEPSAEGIIFARPTMSQALYIQAIGRGLRLHPMKEDCLILDVVGNSEKHHLVQLASLVGFSHETGGGGSSDEQDEVILPEETAKVIDADIRDVREVPLLRRLPGRYTWRDTSFGWILQIPRIGYYLITPHGQTDGRVMVRFYDRRAGRENTPPRDVLGPVTFEFAHGLVEAEMERLVRGVDNRKDEGAAPPIAGLFSVDDGIGQLTIAETLVLQDQAWHEKRPTTDQRRLMLNLGIKEKSFPETAGEAAELIDIVRTERDMRRRQPATAAQLKYLRAFMIPLPEGTTPTTLTKAQATKLIVQHKFTSGEL